MKKLYDALEIDQVKTATKVGAALMKEFPNSSLGKVLVF